jgi:nucleotide-binding universal stress UspA family protein
VFRGIWRAWLLLLLEAIAGWLVVVAVSAFVVALLARRWGHDPFGWILLSAAMGPIVIAGLVGARIGDLNRSSPGKDRLTSRGGEQKFRILAACDGSAYGSLIARGIVDRQPDAEVTVLAVLPRESEPGQDQRSQMDHDDRVAAMTKEPLAILGRASIPTNVAVAYGVPGEEIVRCAEADQPDLVMVGRRGTGLTKLFLGSVSDYVVRWTDRPVLVVGSS